MSLTLKAVRGFMRKMNPCDFIPYYAEDCSACMEKFCTDNQTTPEEYRRKKDHLHTLQIRIGQLQGEILRLVRLNPRSDYVAIYAEQLVNLEKEIENT